MYSLIIWEEITPKQAHARLLLRKEDNAEELIDLEHDLDEFLELFREDPSFQLWQLTTTELGYSNFNYGLTLVFDEDQATPDADKGYIAAFVVEEGSRKSIN